MYDSKSKHQQAAATQPHDAHGQFAPKDQVKETVSVSGALPAISADLSKVPSENDDLVDVKVHNPLHRITKLLQDIKSHQSTTVSMRFTIPLIALPIVLLVAFQLGRAQTNC